MTALTPPHLSPPRILPSGDAALTVEFARIIDPEANRRVLALDRELANKAIDGVNETVPTYRSLLVHYDPVRIGFAELSKHILSLAVSAATEAKSIRRWRVPVVYGGKYGIDLDEVARRIAQLETGPPGYGQANHAADERQDCNGQPDAERIHRVPPLKESPLRQ